MQLEFVSDISVTDGYGSMAEHMMLAFESLGIETIPVPLKLNMNGLREESRKRLSGRSKQARGPAPVLFNSFVRPEILPYLARDFLFIHTMWEASRLPDGWADVLNRACRIFVPTRFVRNAFRDSGVHVKVVVAPDGVDPTIYRWVDRPLDRPVTTLMVGVATARKHYEIGIRAWRRAFEMNPHAKLIIKARHGQEAPWANEIKDDPRIRLIHQDEDTRGILHWYAEADVLLALGNEGFGLPLVEGMASGLPVIALNSEGQSDVCEEAGEYLLPIKPKEWEQAVSSFGTAGFRGVPDENAVVESLRWVEMHRYEARQIGRSASDWALKNRDVSSKGVIIARNILNVCSLK